MGKCFEFRDAFPPIQDVIDELCPGGGEAEHDGIVSELMRHPKGSLVIEDALARYPQGTQEWIASNMVQ